jgi:hypothetical protein
MFTNSAYLQLDDGAFDNEDCNQYLVDIVNIVDIGGLMAMDENSCFDNVDVLEGSFAPMDRALACLHETMVEITMECNVGASVELCDHATSRIQEVGSNIHHLRLVQINKSMHPRMVFRQVDDGIENSINQMKDWHETILEHLNTYKKRTRE